MKRDLGLLRQILFKIEETTRPFELQASAIKIEGFDEQQICYHCLLLSEEGLIRHGDLRRMDAPVYDDMIIERLTSAGHDFIDAARSDKVWKKSLAKVTAAGGSVTISVLKTLLIQTAKEALGL